MKFMCCNLHLCLHNGIVLVQIIQALLMTRHESPVMLAGSSTYIFKGWSHTSGLNCGKQSCLQSICKLGSCLVSNQSVTLLLSMWSSLIISRSPESLTWQCQWLNLGPSVCKTCYLLLNSWHFSHWIASSWNGNGETKPLTVINV